MDAVIKEKMRTFLFKSDKGGKYLIGVCYGRYLLNNSLKEEKHFIIFIGESRIDDFLGSNIAYFANLVHDKVISKTKIKDKPIEWYQYYPGYNGFADTFEEVLLDWDSDKERYCLFLRRVIDKDQVKLLINSLKDIF